MNTSKSPKETTNKNQIANRNVAIYFSMVSLSPPVELHAAMTKDLLSRGNKVTVYFCDSSFKSPMDNPFNRALVENFRMFRAKDAIKGQDVKLKIIHLDGISVDVTEKTSEALGTGTMSSFASMLKAQNKEELSPKWLAAYDNMLGSSKKLYNYFVDEIKNENYDFVFMFNGRFGDVRPVLEATRDSDIGYGLYEMKKSINEIVFINELVHSIDGNTRRALASYAKDKQAAELSARKFFERKTENKETGDPIYTKSQKKGSLPDAVVNTDKKVIAIYPTTDDEYKFIGKEWDGHIPEDQVLEIEELAAGLSPEKYLLVVKMHPNQANTAENTIERYAKLARKYTHVVVEKPLSDKDTYALMNRADVIVTFASTIGVEACYAGKPVILIGDTNWGKLDIAHKVYSGGEASKLIENGVSPKPKLGAIIWGNYSLIYKDELPGFKVAGKGDYFVDGRRIGKSTIRRILQLPAKFEMNINRPGFKFGGRFVLKIIDTTMNIFKGKWAMK